MPSRSKKQISITLAKWDWEAIKAIMYKIGGAPKGRRGAADRLYAALDRAKVEMRGRFNHNTGNQIHFKP